MSTTRKVAILLMTGIAIIALYRSTVKSIAYQDSDKAVTEGGKFMHSLPENAIVLLMLLGVGAVYKKYV